jgi:hypothetical protein
MNEVEIPESPSIEIPIDSEGPMALTDADNSAPIQLPKSGRKELKTNQVAPSEIQKPMHLHDPRSNPLAPTGESQQPIMGSPKKLGFRPRRVPDQVPNLDKIDDKLPKHEKALSIPDPLDEATERSTAFNAFFGIFFASGGLYSGYGLGILGPLGEKWLTFNYGITDEVALFYGMANVGYAIGACFGYCGSNFLCEGFGRVKLLFLSEVMMLAVHILMWVNNIWLFLA